MNKTLFIVAAGLSTRFGGKPKHLVEINGEKNIARTLSLAKDFYDTLVVVLNEKTTQDTVQETARCVMHYGAHCVHIPSGKGDADAVYQALLKEPHGNKVSICWGDAWFKSNEVFKIASKALEDRDYSNVVFDAMCAMEENPYGWFTVDSSGTILNAEFASDPGVDGIVDGAYAAHDQCFFNISTPNFKELFEQYVAFADAEAAAVKHLIELYTKTLKLSLKYEMSWYKMINWSNSKSSGLTHSMKSIATILEKPAAMSFNTEEDLEKIRNA